MDFQTGSVYITGTTKGSLDENTNVGDADLFLVKYDSAGNKEWTRQLGTNGRDEGNGIAVDPKTGSIYITGTTKGSLDGNSNAGDTDFFLVKYDSAGNKEWTRQIGTNGRDEGNGIAVDSQTGLIYVTGTTEGSLDGNTHARYLDNDIFLLKYDPAGNKEWTRQIGTKNWDQGNGIAVDPKTGSIYVTGATGGNLDGHPNARYTGGDLFLLKYDSAGNKEWTRQLGTDRSDKGNGIAVNSKTGSIYVTGETDGGLDGNPNPGDADIFLLKYDPAGNKEWTRQLGTDRSDKGNGIAVNSKTGSIYITGETNGSLDGNPNPGNTDIVLIKYSPAGDKEWTRQFGTGHSDKGRGITVHHKTGSIYITGETYGGLDGNPNAGSLDLFIVKQDPTATTVTTTARTTTKTTLTTRPTPSRGVGTKRWARQLGTYYSDKGNGVAVDLQTGSIYVTGYTYGNLSGNTNAGDADLFLDKYDPAGNKEWTRQIGTAMEDKSNGVAVDPKTGSIYVTGYTYGNLSGNTNAGDADLFLVKYDSAGNKEWTHQFGTDRFDKGAAAAVDPKTGSIYVTGYTRGGLDGNTNVGALAIFLVKYNPAGNKEWTRQFGTKSLDPDFKMDPTLEMISRDEGNGIAVDPQTGSIYVTGATGGHLDGNTNADGTDLFLVKYDLAGNKEWTRQIRTDRLDKGAVVAVDPKTGSIYVTGATGGNLDGNTNAGGTDLFLVKYDLAGNKEWTRQIGTEYWDQGNGVAVDLQTGSIYVTGTTGGSLDGHPNAEHTNGDLFLVKYDSSGKKEWTRQLGRTKDQDEGNGVAVDPQTGSIYVTGATGGSVYRNNPDIFLVKYD